MITKSPFGIGKSSLSYLPTHERYPFIFLSCQSAVKMKTNNKLEKKKSRARASRCVSCVFYVADFLFIELIPAGELKETGFFFYFFCSFHWFAWLLLVELSGKRRGAGAGEREHICAIRKKMMSFLCKNCLKIEIVPFLDICRFLKPSLCVIDFKKEKVFAGLEAMECGVLIF